MSNILIIIIFFWYLLIQDKEAEALKFGAHEYWCSKDFTPEFVEKAEKFDFILSTVAVDHDYSMFLSLLSP